LRNCPCPVWVIKASEEERFSKILVAVDPRPLGQDRDPQNIKLLDLATSIAATDKSELNVVFVWPHRTDPPKSNQQDGQTMQQSMLAELIKPYQDAGRIDHIHLRKGNAGTEIAKLAEELKVELLVMGTVCSTSVTDLFIGNTAERVLDEVDCSVLTVKPDDFVTAART
jgi:nucleotide-binding universal stress UspA family protein